MGDGVIRIAARPCGEKKLRRVDVGLQPQDNGVRVANGSVHGVGIYTAYVGSASLSWSYSRGPSKPMLVCGVLDPRTRKVGAEQSSQKVTYTGSARIFFEENLVAPLFEASTGSLPCMPQPVISPAPAVAAILARIWVALKELTLRWI